jgi:hypothetical protein
MSARHKQPSKIGLGFKTLLFIQVVWEKYLASYAYIQNSVALFILHIWRELVMNVPGKTKLQYNN